MPDQPVRRIVGVFAFQRSVAVYRLQKAPPPPSPQCNTYASSRRSYIPPPTKKPLGNAHILAIVLLVCMVFVASLYLLREPIKDVAKAHADDKKQKLMEAKAKLDYQTLVSEVRLGLEQTTRRLNQLETSVQELQTQSQVILGVPMEELVSHPNHRPRDLDLAILKSDAFARNWAGLVNAHIFPVDVELKYATLEYIRTRLQTESVQPEDKNTLTRLGNWSATRQEFTNHQIRNLHVLSEIMQMNQLHENLKRIEEGSF